LQLPAPVPPEAPAAPIAVAGAMNRRLCRAARDRRLV
jgi:hypothetical protein